VLVTRRDALPTVATLAAAFILASLVGLTISLAFRSQDTKTIITTRPAPAPAAPQPAAPHTYAVAGLGGLREAPPVTPLPARRPRPPKRVHRAPAHRPAPARRAAPAPVRRSAPEPVIAVRRSAPVQVPAPVQRVASPAPAPVVTPHVVVAPQPRPAPAPAPRPRPAAPPIVFDDSG
jgi:hypothetical protein